MTANDHLDTRADGTSVRGTLVRPHQRRSARTVLAILVPLAILAVLLLSPLPRLNRGFRAVLDLGHAPAFAAVTVLLHQIVCRLHPASGARSLLLITPLMIGFGLVTEVLQSQTGRNFTLHDAVANTMGVAAGVCWSVRCYLTHGGLRTRLSIASVLILVIPCIWPALTFVDIIRQQAEMPVLASFETDVELRRWAPHDSRMTRVPVGVTHGERALRVDLSVTEYPGVTLAWPVDDWSAYDHLVFDLFVQDEDESDLGELIEPDYLIVKIEDIEHDGEYEDRFHHHVPLKPGKQAVRIPLEDVAAAPENRYMDLRNISILQFFVYRPTKRHTFYIDHVRLE